MGYPAFLAEVALPENRKNLHFSIASGYGTALVFGLLAAASHAFHLLPYAWPLYVVVALKLLKTDLSADPDFVARFRRDAAATARLRHPSVVRVFSLLLSVASSET